jgi:hypothetical protein
VKQKGIYFATNGFDGKEKEEIIKSGEELGAVYMNDMFKSIN